MIEIDIQPSFVWHSEIKDGLRSWTAGTLEHRHAYENALREKDFSRLPHLLNAEHGGFASVIETDDYIFAATDQVESYKLYLYQKENKIELRSDPFHWLTPDYAHDFDDTQNMYFLMTGYCQGHHTLYRSVKRILPGQYILISKATQRVTFYRYFTYEPDFSDKREQKYLEKNLGDTLDHAIERTLKKADGQTIWLALSAGYDSRVLLGKFLQHGYKRLQTFSYGTPGNMESKVARDLAHSVNVPWRFIPPRNTFEYHDYRQGSGADYLFFAGGLTTTPAMTEFYPLKYLKESGDVAPGDLFTNGQSGDFITGGHLNFTFPCDQQDIISYIAQKHFTLLKSVQRDFNREKLRDFFEEWTSDYTITSQNPANETDKIKNYIAYEWQERQCRYVVNQQRAYDFMELKWSLPLWDTELMTFYKSVPLHLQKGQNLYLSYLQNWNYKNLFDKMRLPYSPWPRYKFLIYSLAQIARLLGGRRAKDSVYRHLYYYTDYHYLYQLFGRKCYNSFLNELRNPVSLQALDYLIRLKQKIDLAPENSLEKRFLKFSPVFSLQTTG